MKGIISVKIDDEGLYKVREQLKESSRFWIEPIHISAGLSTIYAGIGPIVNEFWLNDPRIMLNREPINSLDEYDYMPEMMEIRLTNTNRRALIRVLLSKKYFV